MATIAKCLPSFLASFNLKEASSIVDDEYLATAITFFSFKNPDTSVIPFEDVLPPSNIGRPFALKVPLVTSHLPGVLFVKLNESSWGCRSHFFISSANQKAVCSSPLVPVL